MTVKQKTKKAKCEKVRYPKEIDAKIALFKTSTKGKEQKRAKNERRYYRCPHCAGFHLTSKA